MLDLVDRFGNPINPPAPKEEKQVVHMVVAEDTYENVQDMSREQLDLLREDLVAEAKSFVEAFNTDEITEEDFQRLLNDSFEKIAVVDVLRQQKPAAQN